MGSSDWFPDFQAGREAAFKHVFAKYYRSVYYFTAKILKDDAYTEDIVSETFRKAWESRARIATLRHLENFLYFVARNGCINHLRDERVRKTTDKEWVDLAATDTQEREAQDLERIQTRMLATIYTAINSLGEEVLQKAFMEGKSTKEIAEELGMTENAVYITKSRALKSLRAILKPEEWMLFVCVFLQWFN
jgi:RNA polymerase sigma factor (sigma-70 family)